MPTSMNYAAGVVPLPRAWACACGILALGCGPSEVALGAGSAGAASGPEPADRGSTTSGAASTSTAKPVPDAGNPAGTGGGSHGGSSSTGETDETFLPGPPFEDAGFLAPYETVPWSYGPGAGWADIDRDGREDLITIGGHGGSHVYLTREGGEFDPWAADAPLAALDETVGVALADYDNDGWIDIYVVRWGPDVLLKNIGGAELLDVTANSGLGAHRLGSGAAWADYDGDGWLDLYVANSEDTADMLYHAEGDGTFTDVSHLVPTPVAFQAFQGVWLDYDDDGDLDLFVANDKQVGNALWRNDGPGCGGWCFANVAEDEGAAMAQCSMGAAVGDYDGDLTMDIVFSDVYFTRLLRGNGGVGEPRFSSAGKDAGLGPLGVGWGVSMFDLDNDGWLDIYVSEGIANIRSNQLYRNRGDGTFEDLTIESGCADRESSFGTAHADYDEDGEIDLVVSNRSEGHRLYRGVKRWPDRHWLTVDLVGAPPINRDAIGARVWVVTTGGHTMVQEVHAGSSVGSNPSRRLHFGLGLDEIAQIIIRWPDGRVEFPEPPEPDGVWVHTYPDR